MNFDLPLEWELLFAPTLKEIHLCFPQCRFLQSKQSKVGAFGGGGWGGHLILGVRGGGTKCFGLMV